MYKKIDHNKILRSIELSGEFKHKHFSERKHRYYGEHYNVMRHLAKFLDYNPCYPVYCLCYNGIEQGNFSFKIWNKTCDIVITIKCESFVKFEAIVKNYAYHILGEYVYYKSSDGYKTRSEFLEDFNILVEYLETMY